MTSLADRLDNVHVVARTPGGELEAELRGLAVVSLKFAYGTYGFTARPWLENALETLLAQLWAGWQRQYRAAIAQTDLVIDADDQHDLNFGTERDETAAGGTSDDGRITVSTTGLIRFFVRIDPATVGNVPEQVFVAGFLRAAATMLRDFQNKLAVLKSRYYDEPEPQAASKPEKPARTRPARTEDDDYFEHVEVRSVKTPRKPAR